MTEAETENPVDQKPKLPDDKRPLSNRAQMVSAWFAVLGFVLSVCVFTVVIYQVLLIKQNAQIAAARQVYMSYSESALRYPEFVEPDFLSLKNNAKEFVRYKGFVAHMLFAYDEIFTVYHDAEWRKSFDDDIYYHMTYICAYMKPSDDEAYFAIMRQVLKETRLKCSSALDPALLFPG
jgi:hypothetical protein